MADITPEQIRAVAILVVATTPLVGLLASAWTVRAWLTRPGSEENAVTPEERALKCLRDLTGESTTMGYIGGAGPESDPNLWWPRAPLGESYSTILAAIREAEQAARPNLRRADPSDEMTNNTGE